MRPNAVMPARRKGRRGDEQPARAPAGGGGRAAPERARAQRGDRAPDLARGLLVQRPQLGARLDADLLDERRARILVSGERLRLAAGAVQREHPLARGGARAAAAPRRAR